MTEKEFKELRVGDLVRHISGREAYVVTDSITGSKTLCRTIVASNPGEWLRVGEASPAYEVRIEFKYEGTPLSAEWVQRQIKKVFACGPVGVLIKKVSE